MRAISNQEGNRLLRIVRRGTGSVVTWRRPQMVLLSAQAMDVPQIARVTFTSEDRVRDVIHNFNADGFEALYPRHRGGRAPTFTLPERRQIKQVALSRPADHGLAVSTPHDEAASLSSGGVAADPDQLQSALDDLGGW